jgi:hypothetical protein
LLVDLCISCDAPTPLLHDNTGTKQIAVKHELTKHIGVDASFIRSHCHKKTITLQYMPSELQVADFFTKAQTREQHRLHSSNSMLQILHFDLEFEGGVKYIN